MAHSAAHSHKVDQRNGPRVTPDNGRVRKYPNTSRQNMDDRRDIRAVSSMACAILRGVSTGVMASLEWNNETFIDRYLCRRDDYRH